MRNIFILLASVLLLTTSSATKKYGCGLTSTKTPTPLYRGKGHIEKVDSGVILIRIDGVIIKNDSFPTEVKFVLVYGSFYQELKPHVGSNILFESTDSTKEAEDILYIKNGCIENDFEKDKDKLIAQWKN